MLEPVWLLLGVFRGAARDRHELVLENLLLRHKLAVALRSKPRPQLRRRDKLLWALAGRFCQDWRRHLMFVRPETVVRWHRRGWRLCWWWKSRCPLGRPRLSAEVRELIATISRENR